MDSIPCCTSHRVISGKFDGAWPQIPMHFFLLFKLDIEVCSRCGVSVRVIACIEDQDIMPDKAGQALDRILDHRRQKERETPTRSLLVPQTRAQTGTR